MDLWTSDIAGAVDGELVGEDVVVSGAGIDSRALGPGQLFVPVVAERDGHDFVPAALAAGAAAYLTARPPVDGPSPAATAVTVADTGVALSTLGRHVRERLGASGQAGAVGAAGPAGDGGRASVVGVTGSVGKTTVKDLLAAVLGADRRTWASERSFNNELGVPLTLVNAPEDVEAVVVEMGARGVGHVKDLCDVALPDVGVVTRVAAVHTEQFGTLDDVARAKGELVASLPESGVAVLNAADPRVAGMAGRTAAEVVTFSDGGDVRAEDVAVDGELRPSFRLAGPWGSADVRLAGARGVHMVENALAAAAAALACGVPLATVAGALESAALSPWRMELHRSPAGGVVLNDAYNANPTSTAAALRSLAALAAERRVAVLGVMAELGVTSESDHRTVGDLARDLGIEVVAVGEPGYGGLLVGSVDEAVEAVAEGGVLPSGTAVLVKGSRVAGLERAAELLAR